MQLVVRTAQDPATLESAVRAQIAGIDPQQSIVGLQTLEDMLTRSTARRRFQTVLVGTFAQGTYVADRREPFSSMAPHVSVPSGDGACQVRAGGSS